MKYILEVTQAEAYVDFKRCHPNVKVSIRMFEKLKPFFVIQARQRDIESCCCRYHVEARYLFKSCMDFRRRNTIISDRHPVYEHLTDLANATMCSKEKDAEYHNKDCIERHCTKCGVHLFSLSEGELSVDDSSQNVQWMCYEYCTFKFNGTEKKKLTLVKKDSKPGVMFQYFQRILEKYTAHAFRARWQAEQLRWLKQHLPPDEVICVHDFSENYSCKEKIEIQSNYFQRTEATLHVSLIYRHAILEVDGIGSADDDPHIVEEHLLVISPDLKHDHHFTHNVQSLICEYLHSIQYDVKTVHEYTDGCASQYKSRHCVGDISYSKKDFGYNTVRNYFETSHAKGTQDAAGGLIKRQADAAVHKGKAIIQCAQDLFDYATRELSVPKKTEGCTRRIFRYIPEVMRTRPRLFKTISNIRSLHQVRSADTSRSIDVRNLSCYDCDKCIKGEMSACKNYAGPMKRIIMQHESSPITDVPNETDTPFNELVQPGVILAVYTDDVNYSYYMVKCTGARTMIETEETDSWGNTFPPGADVVTGLYFDKVKESHLKYKLLHGKPVIIPFAAVRFVCIGLVNENNKLSVTEELHREILSSL